MNHHAIATSSAIIALAVMVPAVLVPAGSAHAGLAGPNTFIGSTTNWHTPGNWSYGHSPIADEDVLIDAAHSVIIDPASGPASVAFRDITISGNATLETLPGVQYTSRDENINSGGALIHRSTRALDLANNGAATYAFGGSGLLLNPTPKNKRIVVLQSSVTFTLGGTLAASNTISGAYGPGHYATLTTDNATLGGTLDLETLYGFSPSIGQTFQIMNIGTTRAGLFDGLPEGAFVKGFGAVGLYISYLGGDGNDVVLTAGNIPAPGGAAALLSLAGILATRRRR